MRTKNNKLSQHLILIVLFSFVLSSCLKKGIEQPSNVEILPGEIYSIETPEAAKPGEKIKIIVKFYGGNDGCANPSHLRAVQNDYNIVIQSFYSYPIEPGICTMAVPKHKLSHEFTPHKKGTYKISASNDETIYRTIIVE